MTALVRYQVTNTELTVLVFSPRKHMSCMQHEETVKMQQQLKVKKNREVSFKTKTAYDWELN